MLLFRPDTSVRTGSVFRSALASGIAQDATSLTLESGDGARLPEPGPGESFHLRLGSDSFFEVVVVTGRSGDVLTCEPIQASVWPMGTAVVGTVAGLTLEAFVQREELGTAGDTWAGNITWTQGAIANGATVTKPLAIAGIQVGDFVTKLAANIPLQGLQLYGEVTAPDTLTLYLANRTGGSVTLGSLTVWAKVADNPDVIPPVNTLDPANKGASISLSGGNLTASSSTSAWASVKGTKPAAAGVKYFDMTVHSGTFAFIGIGMADAGVNSYAGADGNSWGWDSNGGAPQKFHSGSGSTYGAAWGAGDTVRIEVDFTAGTLTFYKQVSGEWVSQTVAFSGLAGLLYPMISLYSSSGTAQVTVDLTGWA
jgi:hypothetical protein